MSGTHHGAGRFERQVGLVELTPSLIGDPLDTLVSAALGAITERGQRRREHLAARHLCFSGVGSR